MNIKELLQVADEQSAIQFNGKINLLSEKNSQLLGSIFIINGEIIHLFYKKRQSQSALENLVFDIVKGHEQIRVVEEPEVVTEKIQTLKLKATELRQFVADFMDQVTKLESLRPPLDVCVLPIAKAIKENAELSSLEFDLISTMTLDVQVESIYKSDLMPYEIDRGLYNLRKKGLLKVYR